MFVRLEDLRALTTHSCGREYGNCGRHKYTERATHRDGYIETARYRDEYREIHKNGQIHRELHRRRYIDTER